MNYQSFFLSFIVAFSLQAKLHGQVSTRSKVLIDSLKLLLEDDQFLKGNEKVSINLQIAKLNRNVNPSDQLKYAEYTFEEAKAINDRKSQGIALTEIASHYHKSNQYDLAYSYYEKAISYFENEKNIGNIYSRLSNIEKARGDYVSSISLLVKSNEIFERINFTKGRLANYTNLGILLSLQEDYPGAIEYYQQAESLLTNSDPLTQSKLYTNFAITYSNMDDLVNSKKYTQQSININKQLNDINGLASAYSNLSDIHFKEGDKKQSIEYLLLALSEYKQANNLIGQAGCYTRLGGMSRIEKNYSKAKEHLLKAHKIALKTTNHDAILKSNQALFKLYEDTEEWDKAFAYLLDFNIFKDSITNHEKIKITKELQTKYESDRIKKDREIAISKAALFEQEAENSRSLMIAIAAIGILFTVLLFFAFYRYRAKQKEDVLTLELKESQKRLQLEQQSRISELKALQSQMNPHFIFNALNSIQDLILLQDVRNSNKYLGKFSDLLRRILNNSEKHFISVDEEIKTLKLYTELEQLRFSDQLSVQFINELSIPDSDDYMIPAMFIQPYIENALKHGLRQRKGEKKLEIRFSSEDDHIICSIDDNGVGRIKAKQNEKKHQKDHLGFSTQANQERIQLLNSGKQKKIKIEMIDKVKNQESLGTTIKLYFPYQENSKLV